MKPDAVHPHPLLQRKLTEAPGVSILDQVGQPGAGALGRTHPPLENYRSFPREKQKCVFAGNKTEYRIQESTKSARETMKEKSETHKCHMV